MKTIITVGVFCIASLLLCLPKPSVLNERLIENPRKKFLIDFLEKTEQDFMITLDTMHSDIINFKAHEDSWSGQEILNHVVTAEKIVFGQIKEAMTNDIEEFVDLSGNDAWLIGKVNDRGIKVKSPLPEPHSSKSLTEVKNEFKTNRKNIANYINSNFENLRIRYGQSPYGQADCYQLFLVIAAHSMRHHHQLLDNIKAYHEQH